MMHWLCQGQHNITTAGYCSKCGRQADPMMHWLCN
jgi:hypothetical protein